MERTLKEFYGENPSKSPDYSRIITEKQFDRLNSLLKDGDIVYGGETDKKELFIAPTLLDNLSPDSPVMTDEIFGPILPAIE